MITLKTILLITWLLECAIAQIPSKYNLIQTGQWTQIELPVHDEVFYYYQTLPGQKSCSNYLCTDGTRWVKISAHSQIYELKLQMSMYQPLESSTDIQVNVGADVGITNELGSYDHTNGDQCPTTASKWTPQSSQEQVFFSIKLLNSSLSGVDSIQVGIMVEDGDYFHPIPGACGTTGVVEDDPSIRISYDDATTSLIYQQSKMGEIRSFVEGAHECPCDFLTSQATVGNGTLVYHVYRAFVSACGSDYHRPLHEEDILNTIKHMSTVEGILQFGTKSLDSISPELVKKTSFGAIPGQGVVYNVLVEDRYQILKHPESDPQQYMTVLTPSHTYACSLTHENGLPSCTSLRDSYYMAAVIVAGVIGLYLAVAGHRFFKTTLFTQSTLFFATIAFILVGAFNGPDEYYIRIAIAMGSGIGLGALFLLMWCFTGWTGLVLLIFGANVGFLFAGFCFATPLGDITLFENDFNFWLSYACLVLLIPALFIVKSRFLSVFSSAVIGCFMILYTVDYFVGSDFDRFYSNTIKRGIFSDFGKSYTGDYFSTDFNGCSNLDMNIGMLIAWILGGTVFFLLQYCFLSKNPIPAAPFTRRGKLERRRRQQRLLHDRYVGVDDESRPLLTQPAHLSRDKAPSTLQPQVQDNRARHSPRPSPRPPRRNQRDNVPI